MINWLLEQELMMELETLNHTGNLRDGFNLIVNLKSLIGGINADGKKILGYGAQQKAMFFQYCNFSEKDIDAIVEVNPDKFGCYTPGSKIPIVSESIVII